MPSRQNYGKGILSFLGKKHAFVPLQTACLLMHTAEQTGRIKRSACSRRISTLLGSQTWVVSAGAVQHKEGYGQWSPCHKI